MSIERNDNKTAPAWKTSRARLSRWRRINRWFRYKYLMLFRAKGGAAMVAAGFSVGLMVEMFTWPTFGLAFFLIFPIVYVLRASFASALIGFVFGKIIYIPMAFLNSKVGGWVVTDQMNGQFDFLPHWMEQFLYLNMKLLIGGIIDGAILGIIVYFPVRWLLLWASDKRREKRRARMAV